jgi:signal transduction histidine kinase
MLKIIGQGAVGSMLFGAYHQYTNNKIMEINNEKLDLQQQYFMDKMKTQHHSDINELKERIHKLETKRNWW